MAQNEYNFGGASTASTGSAAGGWQIPQQGGGVLSGLSGNNQGAGGFQSVDVLGNFSPAIANATRQQLHNDISGQTGILNNLATSNAIGTMARDARVNTANLINQRGLAGQGAGNLAMSHTNDSILQRLGNQVLENNLANVDIRNDAIDRAGKLANDEWKWSWDAYTHASAQERADLDRLWNMWMDKLAMSEDPRFQHAASGVLAHLSGGGNAAGVNQAFQQAFDSWVDGRTDFAKTLDGLGLDAAERNELNRRLHLEGIPHDWETGNYSPEQMAEWGPKVGEILNQMIKTGVENKDIIDKDVAGINLSGSSIDVIRSINSLPEGATILPNGQVVFDGRGVSPSEFLTEHLKSEAYLNWRPSGGWGSGSTQRFNNNINNMNAILKSLGLRELTQPANANNAWANPGARNRWEAAVKEFNDLLDGLDVKGKKTKTKPFLLGNIFG